MVLDEKTEISLSSSTLLLQVTRLQNTKYMYVIGTIICLSLISFIPSYGVAVYIGNQTKFGKNKNKPILKLAESDKIASVGTIVVVCLQV